MVKISTTPDFAAIQDAIKANQAEPDKGVKEAAVELKKSDTLMALGPDLAVAALERKGINQTMALRIVGEAFGISASEVRGTVQSLAATLANRFGAIEGAVDISNANGSVQLVEADITDSALRADAVIIPQKPWEGSRGGIAGAFDNLAQNTGGPVGEAITGALNEFDDYRDLAGGKLPTGSTHTTRTGLPSSDGPSMFIHAATVPFDNTLSEQPADDRMIYAQRNVANALLEMKRSMPDGGHVVWPLLGTGNLGYLSATEAASVMSRAFEKFQEKNPGFRFTIAMKNVTRDATFGDDYGSVRDVFNGDKAAVKPPKFEDSRDMLERAVSSYKTGAKDGEGATLDAAMVGKSMDTWSSQFLDSLRGMDSATLNDRTAARAHLSGPDKEAFSMLHKVLEHPTARAELFGDSAAQVTNVKFNQVSVEDFERLLQNPKLQQAIAGVLKNELPGVYGHKGAFTGAADMNQIMSSALGTYLLDRLNKVHGATLDRLDTGVSAAQQQLDALMDKLQLSEEQRAGLQSENRSLEASMARLERELSSSNRDTSRLTRQLADLREQVETLEGRKTTRDTYVRSTPVRSTGS